MKKIWIILGALALVGCNQSSDVIEKAKQELKAEIKEEVKKELEEEQQADEPDNFDDLIPAEGQPSKEEVVQHLGSDNCLREYYEYLTYKANVAWASSADGACGWSGEEMKTVEDAKKRGTRNLRQLS